LRSTLIATLCVSVVALGYVGAALGTSFSDKYLTEPCCGGDALNGTSASLNASSISPDTNNCIMYRADAEDSGVQLIQAGLVRCGSGADLDATCSTSNNLVLYVEIIDSTGHATCYQHGSASTGTEYVPVVQNASGTTWYAYISGTAYEHTSMSTYGILEGAEYTGSSCSGWSGSVTYAGDSTYPWQRFIKSTLSWYTVQTSYNDGGCWTESGSLPGSFSYSN